MQGPRLTQLSKAFRTNAAAYLEDRTRAARYTSFDYCFNYFQAFRENALAGDLAEPESLQESCLQLGFYLASWGMFRGSSKLLSKSAYGLEPVIRVIANVGREVWDIDVPTYSQENIELLLKTGEALRDAFPRASDTLVTKIMLGIFGNVPAFDANFKKGFRVSSFDVKSLEKINAFYRENKKNVDQYRVSTVDFTTGKDAGRLYTRAKVIDMAFFTRGRNLKPKKKKL